MEKVFILDIADFHLLYQEIANIIQSRKGRHFSNPNWLVSVSVGVRAILLHFLRLQTVQFYSPLFWDCKTLGKIFGRHLGTAKKMEAWRQFCLVGAKC